MGALTRTSLVAYLFEDDFPELLSKGVRVTSEDTPAYNCFAWAAGELVRWWSPNNEPYAYWPCRAPSVFTAETVAEAYATIGYERAEDASYVPGIEKIAIFVADDGLATHAARQLASGDWASKLGSFEDIEHSLDAFTDTYYGRVAVVMQRAR